MFMFQSLFSFHNQIIRYMFIFQSSFSFYSHFHHRYFINFKQNINVLKIGQDQSVQSIQPLADEVFGKFGHSIGCKLPKPAIKLINWMSRFLENRKVHAMTLFFFFFLTEKPTNTGLSCPIYPSFKGSNSKAQSLISFTRLILESMFLNLMWD